MSFKPYLAWYVKSIGALSLKSKLEHILNYGDWPDYLEFEKKNGIKKTRLIFNKLTGQRRVNLRPATVSYFEGYFQKYA